MTAHKHARLPRDAKELLLRFRCDPGDPEEIWWDSFCTQLKVLTIHILFGLSLAAFLATELDRPRKEVSWVAPLPAESMP